MIYSMILFSTQDLDRKLQEFSVQQDQLNKEEVRLEKLEQDHRYDVEMKQESLRSIKQEMSRLCSIILRSIHCYCKHF